MGGRASPKLSKNIRTKLEGPWAAVLSLVIASSSPGTGWQLPVGSGDRLAPGWTLWWVTGTAGKSLPGPATEVRELSRAIMNPREHSATAGAQVGPSQAGCPRSVSKQ